MYWHLVCEEAVGPDVEAAWDSALVVDLLVNGELGCVLVLPHARKLPVLGRQRARALMSCCERQWEID